MSDGSGRPHRTFGQQVADALAAGNFLYQGDHRLMLAVNKLQAIGVRLLEQSLLIKLVGKADAATGADGVQPEVIAELVGGDAGFDAVAFNRAGKSPDGLVFRAFAVGPGIDPGFDSMHLAAARRAGIAAHVPHPELTVFFPGNFLVVGLLSVAEIAHRKNTDGIGNILGAGRAPFLMVQKAGIVPDGS